MSGASGRGTGTMKEQPALVGLELIPGAEADAVAEAAADGQDVSVRRHAAVLVVESPGRLEIESRRIAEALGREWATDDLQVIMASYFGFITRWDDDGVTLSWSDGRPAGDGG